MALPPEEVSMANGDGWLFEETVVCIAAIAAAAVQTFLMHMHWPGWVWHMGMLTSTHMQGMLLPLMVAAAVCCICQLDSGRGHCLLC